MIDLTLAPIDMNIDHHGHGRKPVGEGAAAAAAAAATTTVASSSSSSSAAAAAAAATTTAARPKEVDLGDDFQPYPDSVLVGRDKGSKTAEGNQRLRAIAVTMLPVYSNATKKEMKSEIVTQIVERIRTTCPRRDGAFVKQKEGRWYGVPDSVAREKVGYCIRDLLSSKYRSSSASKNERRRRKIQAEQQQVEREVKARLKKQKEGIPVDQQDGTMLMQQQQGQGPPSDFTQQQQQIRGNIDALSQLLRQQQQQQQQRPQQFSDFARMAVATSATGSSSPQAPPSSRTLGAANLQPSLGLPGSMSQLPPAAAMVLQQELLKQRIEQERQHQIRQLQLQLQIEQLQHQSQQQQQQNVAGPAGSSSIASLFPQGLGSSNLGGLGLTSSGYPGALSSSSPAGGPTGALNYVVPPLPGTAPIAATTTAATSAPSSRDVKLTEGDFSSSRYSAAAAGSAANAAGGGGAATKKKATVKKTKSLKKQKKKTVVKKE